MILVEILQEQGKLTPDQMKRIVAHQEKTGVISSDALVNLKMVPADLMEAAKAYVPVQPKSVAHTGLTETFLSGLILKCMYVYGRDTAAAVSDDLKLARSIVRTLIEAALDQALIEALGYSRSNAAEMRYALTDKGRDWAIEAMNVSQYVGPAPVPVDAYYAQVSRQRVANEVCSGSDLAESFSDLVLPAELAARIGPAINSGRSMLFYGPPGNGKTSVAERVSKTFKHSIFVPHCIEVDGQIIKIFDSSVHEPVNEERESSAGSTLLNGDGVTVDPRWVRCRRPLVITGGELTLDMLDLNFNAYARYYEAPLQVKATSGVFVIDDFGRQLVSPDAVLNRWIIPLERGVDFLTLHTGKKFAVTFDELVIFSTNISPRDLMDAGQMRRIYYKIRIDSPTREDYAAIFEREARAHALDLPKDVLGYIYEQFYDREVIPVARFHPRYIIEQVKARQTFGGRPVRLDINDIGEVLKNLYVVE
jgi:hypothetical protein